LYVLFCHCRKKNQKGLALERSATHLFSFSKYLKLKGGLPVAVRYYVHFALMQNEPKNQSFRGIFKQSLKPSGKLRVALLLIPKLCSDYSGEKVSF
jgi:hypothetical protein